MRFYFSNFLVVRENGLIDHKGKVSRIHPDRVEVTVLSETACAGCHAQAICGSDAGQQKVIVVGIPDASFYAVGDEVVVSVERAMGFKAVVIAYVLPFLFVITVLLAMLKTGQSELASGVSALFILCLYYMVVYLLRERISKDIVFKIRKTAS